MASEILDRAVVREMVSDAAFQAGLIAHGLSEVMAEGLGSLYTAARAGEFAVVEPTLERVLGRRPVAMRDVLTGFLN